MSTSNEKLVNKDNNDNNLKTKIVKNSQDSLKEKDGDKDDNLKRMSSEAVYKSFLNKQPNFFNKAYNILANTFCYILGIYILLTLSLYVVVHFNIGSLFKSKSLLLEYDVILFSNFLVNFMFCLIILSNLYLSKRESLPVYYFIQLVCIVFVYLVFSYMTTKDLLLSQFISLMKIIFIVLSFLLTLYVSYFYIASMFHMRSFLSKNFTFDEIYHEISLRTDMMKFSYNNFIIKFKLHKIFPGLLYPRDSFYYLTCKPPASVLEKRELHCNYYKKNGNTDESESVQINVDHDEKQKFISKSSSKNAYLSTMGEF